MPFMILSDQDIKKAVRTGNIIIKPEPDWERQLGSCSLDLRLENPTFYPSPTWVKSHQKAKLPKSNLGKTARLKPGKFLLAVTREYLELPSNICGLLHGRSSLGRKGLMIHSTAPLIDAGFRGKIVLELYNAGPAPIKLKAGMRICAVSFEKLSSPAKVPYYKKKGAKFLGQT